MYLCNWFLNFFFFFLSAENPHSLQWKVKAAWEDCVPSSGPKFLVWLRCSCENVSDCRDVLENCCCFWLLMSIWTLCVRDVFISVEVEGLSSWMLKNYNLQNVVWTASWHIFQLCSTVILFSRQSYWLQHCSTWSSHDYLLSDECLCLLIEKEGQKEDRRKSLKW